MTEFQLQDDDDFGDFEFAPPSLSSSLTNPIPIPVAEEKEDDWGDFLEIPLQFHPSNSSSLPQPQPSAVDLFSDFNTSPRTSNQRTHLASEPNTVSPSIAAKQWEKPRGAIPLSIFCDEEKGVEEDEPPGLLNLSFSARDGFSTNHSEQIKTGVELKSGSVDGNGDADENSWEFKDAFSETGGRDDDFGKEQKTLANSGFDVIECIVESEIQKEQIKSGEDLSSDLLDDNGDFNENSWEFKDAFSETGGRDGDFAKEQKVFEVSGFEVKENAVKGEIEVGTEHGATVENGSNFRSFNGNINFDENGWEFEGKPSKAGNMDGLFENKKERKVADTSWAEKKAPLFDFGFQDSQEMLENQGGIQSLSISSNGKQDSCDVSVTEDRCTHRPTAFVGNGIGGFTPGSTTAFSDFISNLYNQSEQARVTYVQKPSENGHSSGQSNLKSCLVNGDDDWEENGWEFKDAFSEAKTKDQNPRFETVDANASFSTDSKLNNFVNFYSGLEEESSIFVHHHLDVLKKAKENAALSGEEVRVMALDKEIQAEDDLRCAVGLLEHASSTLNIMTLVASVEEQTTYITTWSKMVSVCARELQHGVMIWKQACEKNVHKQIFFEPRGLQYFVALGEIFRVTEVLRASATLYKPWILANSGDSRDLFNHLGECKSAWMDSGLNEALECVLDSVGLEYKEIIKALLDSVEVIHKLDEAALRSHVLGPREPFCKLSLLPLGVLKEMELVFWNGEHYFLKLANLWANRLSCDPPQLPHIQLS